MKLNRTFLPIGIAVLLLSGCASTPKSLGEDSAPKPDITEPAVTEHWKSVTSCDQVQPFVADYTTGLVLVSGDGKVDTVNNGDKQWSVTCRWEGPADDATKDILKEQVLWVEVTIEPNHKAVSGAVIQVPKGFTAIENARVEAAGGQAYSVQEFKSSVEVEAITVVEFPDTKVSLSTGLLGDQPDLDPESAVQVTLALLKI